MKTIMLEWKTYKDTGTTLVFACVGNERYPITVNFQGIQGILSKGEIALWAENKSFEENKIMANKLFEAGILEDTGHRISIKNKLIKKCKILKKITKVV